MTRGEYEAFLDALLAAEKTSFKEWEASTPYFDGCLPIEVMAERGRETLRFGPMKPVGLTNPHKPGERPLRGGAAAAGQCAGHAVEHGGLPDQAQARRAGPHLPHDPGPGGGRVRAARRPAPQHLPQLARSCSTASCACAPSRGCGSPARSRAARAMSRAPPSACWRAAPPPPSASARPGLPPPPTTAFGALLGHITGGHLAAEGEGARSFQPMNVNFGLFPPLDAPVPRRRRQPHQGQGARAPPRSGPCRPARSPISTAGLPGRPSPRQNRWNGVRPLAATVVRWSDVRHGGEGSDPRYLHRRAHVTVRSQGPRRPRHRRQRRHRPRHGARHGGGRRGDRRCRTQRREIRGRGRGARQARRQDRGHRGRRHQARPPAAR